jgi:rubredoxin
MTRFERILSEALANLSDGTKCPQCGTSIIIKTGEPTRCSICGYSEEVAPADKPIFIGDRYNERARMKPPMSIPGMNVGGGGAGDRAGGGDSG